ncbi:MAG: preprotein translocase subunit SecG [Candidatus Paceibacterota bacterium]|jgi:protein translocase SecG subunit
MISYLPYIQIILAVILIGLILLQHSDASIGSAFGGDSLGGTPHTRRGPEKAMFVTTIIVAVLFVASAFIAR